MLSTLAVKYRWFRSELRRAEVKMAYVMLLPALIPLVVFVFLPVVAAVGLSFSSLDLFHPTSVRWIGLGNYTEAFESDLFHITLRNTSQYTIVFVPASILVGFSAAILLNRRFPGVSFIRGAYYLPVLTSSVAMGVAWTWLFQPQAGLISQVIKFLGGMPRDWLGNPNTAMPAVVGVAVWKAFGTSMLIYLAGLQGIPDAFYDAAKIDGANSWQSLRYITWPLLRPVTFYLFIIGVIQSLQVFDLIMVMTDGGPAFRTTSIVHQIYLNAFKFNRTGYASAMAVILFVVIATLTLVNYRFFSSSEIEY